MDWFRWHHGTATDPKWRLVAVESGQSVAAVLAVWALMLERASQSEPRGSIEGWSDRVAAAALDLPAEAVESIRVAMQGLVLDGDDLPGWKKRQPKREREDSSTERVRRYREKPTTETHVTPSNATKRPDRGEREEESIPPCIPPGGGSTTDAERKGSKRRKSATPFPSDWHPSEQHAELAEERGVDVEEEAEKFRDWAESKDERKVDWGKAFNNWLRNARPPAGGYGGSGGAYVQPSGPVLLDSAEIRRRDEAEEAASDAWKADVAKRFAALPPEERERWKDQVRPELVHLEGRPERHERILRQLVYERFGASVGCPLRRAS